MPQRSLHSGTSGRSTDAAFPTLGDAREVNRRSIPHTRGRSGGQPTQHSLHSGTPGKSTDSAFPTLGDVREVNRLSTSYTMKRPGDRPKDDGFLYV